ncbi:MAG: lipopolysaccharide biosynthesis protein [Atopobiaceae bacterium]
MKLVERYRSLSVMDRSTIWFVVCNCIMSGMTYISMPFFTRLMSSEQYGIVTVYNSWLQLITVFATLNLSSGAFNNGMVRYENSRNGFSSAMQGLMLAQCLFVFGLTAILYAVGVNILGMSMGFIVCMFVQIYMTGIFLLYAARQRYDYQYVKLTKMTVAYALLMTAFSIVVVALVPDDSMRAFAKVAASAVGTSVVGIYVIVKTQRKQPCIYQKSFWKYAYTFSIPLIPHYLALTALAQIDRIQIADIIDGSTAAMYAVAYTIGIALSIVSSAMNSATVPFQFEKIHHHDLDGIASRLNAMMLTLVGFGLLAVLVSPELLEIAAPPAYYPAAKVIAPVAASVVFTFLYNILSNYEFYFQANKFIAAASVCAALANYLLNLITIPAFGFVGAAFTTLACYMLLALAHSIFARYICRKNLPPEDAHKLASLPKLWGIAVAGSIVMMLASLLYPLPLVRLLVIAAGCVLLYRRRNTIAVFLKK